MNSIITILVPVLALAVLVALWMAVQILAKRMDLPNHIDETNGCCGACTKKDECENKMTKEKEMTHQFQFEEQ